MITGYFIKPEEVIPFIKRKARALLVPYTVTCIIIVMLSAIKAYIKNDDVMKETLNWIGASLYGSGKLDNNLFTIKGIGGIWFLWSTFWGVSLLQMLLKCKYTLRFVAVGLVFLLDI